MICRMQFDRIVVAAIVLCLLPVAAFAQAAGGPRMDHENTLPPTPIGPTPGPPPPCGMQNVLCKFRWHTSAPTSAGEVSPTCAFMLAPSM